MIRRFATWMGITRRSVWLNVLCIAIFITVIFAVGVAQSNNPTEEFLELGNFLVTLILQMLIPIYLHFALWRFTMAKRKFLWYILGLLTIVLGWPFFIHTSGISEALSVSIQMYGQSTTNTFFGILFATGIRAIYRSFVRDREIQKLKRERIEGELAGLKAQLNPHFLFNTLNNIHGINLDNPERGSEMLLELADVMRYHYELSQKEQVPLAKEVELIRSVAELEGLRLRNNTQVELALPPAALLQGRMIAPLLLIPFVENAFKHGAHPTREGKISISLKVEGDRLVFNTENPVFRDRQTVSTGVGMTNVRQRLDLLHKGDYQLTAGAEEGTWSVHLEMPTTHVAQ